MLKHPVTESSELWAMVLIGLLDVGCCNDADPAQMFEKLRNGPSSVVDGLAMVEH